MFTHWIKQRPLIAFFVLAFAISWIFGFPSAVFPDWPGLLTFLMGFGPVIAAILVAAVTEGKNGVRLLIEPIKHWRVGIQWYFIVLIGPAITMVAAVYLYGLFGNGPAIPDSIQVIPMIGDHLLILLFVFFYQVIIIWGEEIGWRGYALPRLQSAYHPLLASVILGVLWGLWHLPFFWMAGSVHQSMSLQFFILATVGYSILYTWIYNGTKGSLLLICLLHAANNTTVSYTMLFFKPLLEEPIFSLAILGLFNLVVIIFAGPKILWQERQLKP
jgi:membrane protease YdiL (CAAX protease family)